MKTKVEIERLMWIYIRGPYYVKKIYTYIYYMYNICVHAKSFRLFRIFISFFHPARADQAITYILLQAIPFRGGSSAGAVQRRCAGLLWGGGERERSIKCQPVYLELSSSLLYIRPRDLPSDRGGPKTIQLPRIGTVVGGMGTGRASIGYVRRGCAGSSSPSRQLTCDDGLPPIDRLAALQGLVPPSRIHQLT